MQASTLVRCARGLPPALLLALQLTLGASAAQAATFSFEGATDSGPLAGLTFSGSFGYDEPVAGFDGSVALQAFLLDFGGQTYSLATADAGTLPAAVFAAGGFVGIDFLDTGSADLALRPQVQFTAGFFDLGQAFLSYQGRDAAGATLLGFGSYSVSPAASAVPEPGGLAMVLAGLGALALLRRSPLHALR
ncbi:PEP-CTERM domain-containing protein [Rubrivivax sp. A210]|uniref:PEP-CTERM sorting domain-containing protein n=1 Tax=Rubrivivax sp. A210 TaxID=2772301 RepID=UPI001918C4DC|nr:PEP-CTERM sorting domain-containing protein [Rubrivivax sp. A210]CAD5371325.1 PEP-CTERM domain-containing protein [Rubrivivax sp. A210]